MFYSLGFTIFISLFTIHPKPGFPHGLATSRRYRCRPQPARVEHQLLILALTNIHRDAFLGLGCPTLTVQDVISSRHKETGLLCITGVGMFYPLGFASLIGMLPIYPKPGVSNGLTTCRRNCCGSQPTGVEYQYHACALSWLDGYQPFCL